MFIQSYELRKTLCRFIISANDLQVEKRRYELVKNKYWSKSSFRKNQKGKFIMKSKLCRR